MNIVDAVQTEAAFVEKSDYFRGQRLARIEFDERALDVDVREPLQQDFAALQNR